MSKRKHLFVGGLVAMGFDATGKFLLVLSHSGRGVVSTRTWESVFRDLKQAYPRNGQAEGVGPIKGQIIPVLERDETNEQIQMSSPDGKYHLLGEIYGITITTCALKSNLKNSL